MHQHLAAIKRAEIARLGIAQPDHAQKLVVHGVGDRDGVGELLGGIDAVAMTGGNVRRGSRAGRLSGEGGRGKEQCGEGKSTGKD